MNKLLQRGWTLLSAEDGPTAVEYALLLGLCIVGLITAVQSIALYPGAQFESVAQSMSGVSGSESGAGNQAAGGSKNRAGSGSSDSGSFGRGNSGSSGSGSGSSSGGGGSALSGTGRSSKRGVSGRNHSNNANGNAAGRSK